MKTIHNGSCPNRKQEQAIMTVTQVTLIVSNFLILRRMKTSRNAETCTEKEIALSTGNEFRSHNEKINSG
jgi:hypothetical protein